MLWKTQLIKEKIKGSKRESNNRRVSLTKRGQEPKVYLKQRRGRGRHGRPRERQQPIPHCTIHHSEEPFWDAPVKMRAFRSRHKLYMMTWFRSFRTTTARDAWGSWRFLQTSTVASSAAGGDARYLPQKRVQAATAKEHWKNKWLIDSLATEQRTQPGCTFNPQEIKRSRVGSLPRKAVQQINEHRGISSLNQTIECHWTDGLGVRILSQVTREEKDGPKPPDWFLHK